MKHTLPLVLLTVTLAGCDRSAPPPPPGTSTKAPGAAPGGAPGASQAPLAPPAPSAGDQVGDLTSPTITLSGVTLTLPAAWKRTAPSNSMRLAEMRIPSPEGNANNDCVVTFSQAGGTVQWNLERWKTQVVGADGKPAEADLGEVELGGVKIHTFTSTGSYQDGMPGGAKTPRDRWTLRGAVLETTPNLTFIKMWGPMQPMASSEDAWNHMLHSIVKAGSPANAVPDPHAAQPADKPSPDKPGQDGPGQDKPAAEPSK